MLPGDELVETADVMTTRAITVENLLGLDIHSAETILPGHQAVEVGTTIRLAAEVPLTVALVEPGRALVLRGSIPMGSLPVPYEFTWTFALCEGERGTTRLVIRERYGYRMWWARLIVEPVTVVSFVMTRRMLRGVRDRAEQP